MSSIPDLSSTSSARETFLAKFCQMAEAKPNNKNGHGSSPPKNSGLEDDLNNKWCHECFGYYDKNGDGFLDKQEFSQLVSDIFNPSTKNPSSSSSSAEILSLLDEDNDARLGFKESRWKKWLKALMKPVSALIVVDVQNDFIDGSLSLRKCPAGQDGAAVVPVINKILSAIPFDLVVYSLDWHDDKHISFIDNLPLRKLDPSSPVSAEKAKVYDEVVFAGHAPHTQVLWPRHCVQGTWGSQLHTDLKVGPKSIQVHKGIKSDIDSYSAFFDNQRISKTELESALRARNATDVYVCGLAYDVCVGYTTEDALDLGFRTYLIDDASKGVKLEDIDQTKKKLTEKGARIIDSPQIKGFVESKVCDIDIALWTAKILSRAKF